MDVFIGNLPKNVSRVALERLLTPFDRRVRISLQQQQDKAGAMVGYALCTFTTERAARKAIAKLDGYHLFGQTLAVHEYRHRSYSSERRDVGWRNRPWDGVERRGGERRLGRTTKVASDIFDDDLVEVVDEDEIVIEGYSSFATKRT